MRWLQLTDLHVGSDQNSTQANALAELVDAIRHDIAGTAIDAVFFTGDIAYSGSSAEYAKFNELILIPLRKIQELSKSQFFSVPGNHDLDCSSGVGISWSTIGETRQKDFFSESEAGQKIRRDRATSFSAYERAVADYGLISPIPSREVSCYHSLHSSGQTLGLILTNTAFFSDKEQGKPGQEPSPIESWRTVLRQITSTSQYNIILAHHPVDWFMHRDTQPVASLLTEKRLLYIHGHVHEVRSACGINGLNQIGFGAVYQDRLSAAPKPYYRNSFAICEWNKGLHVKLVHWDSEHGRWVKTTTLPADFRVSSRISPDFFYFSLSQNPESQSSGQDVHQSSNLPPLSELSPRRPPTIRKVRFSEDLTAERWIEQLCNWNILSLEQPIRRKIRVMNDIPDAGYHYNYCLVEGGKHHRIWVIPATGHVLTRTEVERTNNIYDYDDLESYTIITVGSLAEDGKESYLKLKRKKRLSILTQEDLASQIGQLLTVPVRNIISKLDGADSAVSLYVRESHVYTVIQDEGSQNWFYVLDPEARPVSESNPIVRDLRNYYLALRLATYGPPLATSTKVVSSEKKCDFDISQYRTACFKEFNSVKYAALATTGLRFNKITLEELYINTKADEESSQLSEAALNRAVDDAFQGMQLDSTFRAQLKIQIRHLFKTNNASASGGSAKEMYQRFGAILVLGDPGSGKTFFAKHEILAYAKPVQTWYERHLPVYVGLAEAAQLIDWSITLGSETARSVDFLEVASKLAARYGLELPRDYLEQEYMNGRLAFFFDGLDEVGALDQRSKMWEAIRIIAESVHTRGNRVLVTSRPAAVQVFEIPETIHSITLRGLNLAEMRNLAQRVLAARVAENGISLSPETLNADDVALVDRLIDDCQTIQGIGRLAQNPLLFTLLIMIYANSGPPAAKRHRVYQQAVQTLVSVRNRSTGQKIFSEADLRKRLGAVALSVFRDSQGTVPTWRATVDCIRSIMQHETSETITDEAAEQYIRQVAEATGILVLHKRSDSERDSRITFMHHSFMEYYAAVGLHAEPDSIGQAVQLARMPRWREVIALYSGILGENDDITPFIEQVLDDPKGAEPGDAVTQRPLLTALAYALESEVPPEATQRAVIRALGGSAATSILCDENFRRDIGELLGRLYEASSGDLLNEHLIKELRGSDIDNRAAYIDLVGYIAEQTVLKDDLLVEFHRSYDGADTAILCGACNAISRSSQLRRADSKSLLVRAFKKNTQTRYAVVRAVEHAPSLAKDVWAELLQAISEEKSFIALGAANAILLAGWRIDPKDRAERADLICALRCLFKFGQEKHIAGIGQAVSSEQIAPLLSDPDPQQRLLGLYLIPWIRKAEEFAHDRLMDELRASSSHELKVAALDSLRLSQDGQKLISIGEIDFLCNHLSEDQEQPRDVRMATARLLGAFVRKDNRVLQALLLFAKQARRDSEEFRIALRALASCGATDKKIHSFFESEISDYTRSNRKQTDNSVKILCDLLAIAREMDWIASQNLIRSLCNIPKDYRRHDEVRGQSLVTIGGISLPSEETAKYYCDVMKNPPKGMTKYLCESISRFATRCRRRIEYIRQVNPLLPKLTEQIVAMRAALIKDGYNESKNVSLQHLRTALLEIENMQNAYREYAGRVMVGPDA